MHYKENNYNEKANLNNQVMINNALQGSYVIK